MKSYEYVYFFLNHSNDLESFYFLSSLTYLGYLVLLLHSCFHWGALLSRFCRIGNHSCIDTWYFHPLSKFLSHPHPPAAPDSPRNTCTATYSGTYHSADPRSARCCNPKNSTALRSKSTPFRHPVPCR